MPASTFIDEKFNNMRMAELFTRILAYKGKVRMYREREKDVMISRNSVKYAKQSAKQREAELDLAVKIIKKRLGDLLGKAKMRSSLLSIFRCDKELFKKFLVEKYDFDAWSVVYDLIVDKKIIKDKDLKLMTEKMKMHEKYIDYVRKI